MKSYLLSLLVVALAACGLPSSGAPDAGQGTGATTSTSSSGSSGGASNDAGTCPPPDHWTCCRLGVEREPVCGDRGFRHCLQGWETGVPGHCPPSMDGGTAGHGGAGGTLTTTSTTVMASSVSSSSSTSSSTGSGCDPGTCAASCSFPFCGTCQGSVCACTFCPP